MEEERSLPSQKKVLYQRKIFIFIASPNKLKTVENFFFLVVATVVCPVYSDAFLQTLIRNTKSESRSL